jgi:non-heme chloroperoxidase
MNINRWVGKVLEVVRLDTVFRTTSYDCIKAFSETDFTEDLKKFDVPTLILHGDDDQIVPIGAAALISAKLVKNATLKVYPGFPHGMPTTNADQINSDLLAFIQQSRTASA